MQAYLTTRSYQFMMLIFLSIPFLSSAQKNIPSARQLRGTVLDQLLQKPVEGATVRITSLNKFVITDANGHFRFQEVPVGLHHFVVTSVGYKQAEISNIQVNAGKETVLTIQLEYSVQVSDTVTVKARSKRNRPLNDMSTVSARAFTVEETQRYAAAVNDPLRMATAFPGVVSADDGNNNIIIRGNSPTGLLWRMEGVDIPNPNHFSSTGSSGGGISILSAQLLSNSDFVTGAFAAEYGNALSGVFDLKLRKGNNEKREYTLQAGLLGLNAAAEGPLAAFYKGSYLVNYRYSTLELLGKIGVPLEGGTTNFQDLSYNIYLPAGRAGSFTLFGFGGLSSQVDKAKADSSKWTSRSDRYNARFVSNTGAAGLTHNILLGANTSLRSAMAFSYNKLGEEYDYMQHDYSLREDHRDSYKTRKWSLNTTLNHKISARSHLRTGVIVSLAHFDFYKKTKENEASPVREVINTRDKSQTIQSFAQWQYKPLQGLSLNAGLHYLQLLYNHTSAIEPRLSARWQLNKSNSLSIAFGQHSQVQPPGVYFARLESPDGAAYPNKNLGFTKAFHYVLSYQHSLGKNLLLKAEVYYQQLRDVPISASDTSTLSLLNIENEYVTDPLVNKGRGRNYGIELSLEKYLENRFYYTITTSLYQSRYTAADGVERNTRFNGNYVSTLVAGKDFLSRNKLRTFGVNFRTVYAGGLRITPVDAQASLQKGYTVYLEKHAYSQQNPAYFRTDLRLSMQWNRKRFTSTLSLDIQNLTNRLNVYGQWFDDEQGRVVTSYQNGLIPVLNYKIEF